MLSVVALGWGVGRFIAAILAAIFAIAQNAYYIVHVQ